MSNELLLWVFALIVLAFVIQAAFRIDGENRRCRDLFMKNCELEASVDFIKTKFGQLERHCEVEYHKRLAILERMNKLERSAHTHTELHKVPTGYINESE